MNIKKKNYTNDYVQIMIKKNQITRIDKIHNRRMRGKERKSVQENKKSKNKKKKLKRKIGEMSGP